jgi:hypothetical protein
MSDVADVRQRLQRMIEQARQEAAERRRRAEEDAGTAERFLESVATPEGGLRRPVDRRDR